MPSVNRSTIAKARPTGHGQPNGDAAYAHGSNVARPEADAGVQESLLAEQRELGNNRAERRVRSAWSGKATGRDSVNATISMRMDFLVGTTDAEIIRLLTTSVARSGQPPRWPMPRFYMTRTDAEAAVAYLKSIDLSQR